MRPKDPNPSVLILPNPPFEATPSRSSPRRSNRACLCKDNRTYSRKCCDGSLQAQGIGNITGIATPTPDPDLLLNLYPNAAAAYSLRKLDKNYDGNAIRIRRASDNTEQDIGFVNNELDTSTLTSFCSGTNGFVKTWYDQSGNGYDATQTTAANQPQIVSSGSVILENGKPSVNFNGTTQRFNMPTIAFTMNAISIMVISKSDSSSSNGMAFSNADPYRLYAGYITSSVEYFGYNDSATKFNLGVANTNQSLKELYAGSSTVNAYRNAIASTSVTSVTTSVTGNDLSIGSYKSTQGGTTAFYDGNIQEIIFYTSDQSSNRTGIETNINDFYSIY